MSLLASSLLMPIDAERLTGTMVLFASTWEPRAFLGLPQADTKLQRYMPP